MKESGEWIMGSMKSSLTALTGVLLIMCITACGGSESGYAELTTEPANEIIASDSSTEPVLGESDKFGSATTSDKDVVSGTMGSYLTINEVALGPNGFVTLANFTDVAVSLGGLYLCQGSDCFEMPDKVIESQNTVRVAAGNGEGLENVVATEATYGVLRPTDGELALFASPNTEDPSSLLYYLQWGSTPHSFTEMAVEKGLWFETSFAPSGENATRLFKDEETGLWLWEWE